MTEKASNPTRIVKKFNNKVLDPRKFVERINVENLGVILNNIKTYHLNDCFRPWIVGHDLDENVNDIKQADKIFKRLVSKAKNGEATNKVTYTRKYGRGRMCATDSMSLQNVMREIRQTIAADYYYDVDIKNAHPVFLANIMPQHGIDVPFIKHYVKNRDKILGELIALNGFEKDNAKQQILKVIYGGNATCKATEWMTGFIAEMQGILAKVPTLFPKEYAIAKADKQWNFEGSALSIITNVLEDQIINRVLKYFIDCGIVNKKVHNCVMCFDGIMVEKDAVSESSLVMYLTALEEIIAGEFKIDDFKLDIKPMVKLLPPDELPKQPASEPVVEDDDKDDDDKPDTETLPRTPELTLLESDFTDYDFTKYFVEKYGTKYKYGKSSIKRNDKTGSWYKFNGTYWLEIAEGELSVLIQETIYNDLTKSLLEIYGKAKYNRRHQEIGKHLIKLKNNTTKNNYLSGIAEQMVCLESSFDTNGELLCFQNGVLEIMTETFRPGRPEDMITMALPYNYSAEVPAADTADFTKFINQILPIPEERDYCLSALSTSLYGKCIERFIIFTGVGRNGKDTLATYLMEKLLGPFFYQAPDAVLTQKTAPELSPGIANMSKKRFVVFCEPSANDQIRGGTAKLLTGGKRIPARTLYEKTCNVTNHGTFVVLTNWLLTLDRADTALKRRLCIILFRSQFLSKEDMADVPEGTEHVFQCNDELKDDKFLDRMRLPMLHMLMKYFKQYLQNSRSFVEAPQSCRDLVKEYLEDSDDFYGWFSTVATEPIEGGKIHWISLKALALIYKESEHYHQTANKQKNKLLADKKFIDMVTTNVNLMKLHRAKISYGKTSRRQVLVGKVFNLMIAERFIMMASGKDSKVFESDIKDTKLLISEYAAANAISKQPDDDESDEATEKPAK